MLNEAGTEYVTHVCGGTVVGSEGGFAVVRSYKVGVLMGDDGDDVDGR